MGDKSKIEWTDATWNPVTGCTKVSEGCRNCYAETYTDRFHGKGSFDKIVLHPDRLEMPLRWKKPRMIFVNSMSDLFHKDIPNAFVDKVFWVMEHAHWHTFQVLTKRPVRMREYVRNRRFVDTFNNIWLGVSVENQKTADQRIPILLDTPAAFRWISAEPLLEHVDLNGYLYALPGSNKLDWVVVGGESGPNKRPFDSGWARFLLGQCKAANVPFYMKQFGSLNKCQHDSKGGHFDCFPEDLKIRQFPNGI